jgi:hypothetical protein
MGEAKEKIPMAMIHAQIGIAAVALGILATVTAAQAEIICTQHRGCFETGLRIISHGGVGVGLPYTYNRDDGGPNGKVKKGQRVRVNRETW